MAHHRSFLYEYLRDAYRSEVDRLDKIRERVAFASGFLLVLGGAIASLATSYKAEFAEHFLRDCFYTIGLIIASALFAASAAVIAFCLLRGFRYAMVRSADLVVSTVQSWEAYNRHPDVVSPIIIEDELIDSLCETYSKSAAHNHKVTTRRNELLLNAMRLAFAASLFLIFPAAALIFDHYQTPEKVQHVEIMNPVKIKTDMSNPPPPPPSSPTPPPPPPPRPPNPIREPSFIKEGAFSRRNSVPANPTPPPADNQKKSG